MTTKTTVPAVTVTETTAAETTATAPTAAVRPEPCRLCGLVGKHELPEKPAVCIVCGATHGDVVKREIPRGSKGKMKLIPRNAAVRHSLPAMRVGGLREDGRFVNPNGAWETQPICDDCGHGLKRATYEAREQAKKDGATYNELPAWPEFCALSVQITWVERQNKWEAGQRVQAEKRAEERKAALAKEETRLATIAKLVAKGCRLHKSGNERRGSVPFVPVADRTDKNGGRRNDRGNGKQRAQAKDRDGAHGTAEVESASDAEVKAYFDAKAEERRGALPLAGRTAQA